MPVRNNVNLLFRNSVFEAFLLETRNCAVLLFEFGNVERIGWNETVLSALQMKDVFLENSV
jgi:hypothetical protein